MEKAYRKVEKHLARLRQLKNRVDQTSDPYVRQSLVSELRREAEVAGQAVKEYIRLGGNPQTIADYYKIAQDMNSLK